MKSRQNVEFKTLDGLTLRGWLFPAPQRGPAIIMTPGFNNVKEMIISEVAEYFHGAGFTVLSYDPRSIGESDGMPRNEAHPARNVEDYHDALTYLKQHWGHLVDPTRIAYWGYSFSGMVALCAAALDKRAKAVVAVSPLTIWEFTKWKQVLAKAMKDRESRLAGNNPVRLPMLTENGEHPAGFGTGFDVEDVYNIIARAAEVQPTFVAETTLSTYYHIAAFQPFGLMSHVSPTPAMVVTGEKDLVSPAELQKTLIFDVFKDPKRHLSVPSKGHMNILSGQDSIKVLDAQISFLREYLG
ncbi:DltD N-terminal domain protein [Parathielavia appendiculata]|uniref:DltD N-terminal domain protein n=1 Tax=Parathielavia appendiculata TaxID=2587402 RepID=A0AAN6TTZ1_9PEZI|nr:DltD N-terminal domain protein [Parathielavia appendiculata]